MEQLLAEELLLLALDERTGCPQTSSLDIGLAAALLVDLGRREAVRSEGNQLYAVLGAAPRNPLLMRVHEVMASTAPRSARSWLGRLPRALRPISAAVGGGLVERGTLYERHDRVLGLFPATRLPLADSGPQRELLARLRAVLRGQRPPDEREVLLLGLLLPLELVCGLVEKGERKAARQHAREIADGTIAGSVIGTAVREVQTAVVTSLSATSVVTGTGR
jgi:hypothetical protein